MNTPSLTPAFCAANGILITHHDKTAVYFGMLHSDDPVLRQRVIKAFPEHRCVFRELDPEAFNLKLSQIYSSDPEERPAEEPASSGGDIRNSRESIIDRVADDAPAVNLLNSIFLEALSKGASDIHIESGSGETAIRYRVDGLLTLAGTVSQERAIAVSGRLKILANLNVLENRRPQDGHIDVRTGSYSLDVRVSIVPTIWGESIVLRLLNRSDTPLSLDSLGFSSRHQEHLERILAATAGLILVTGPTGSGKTTTLAAILKELNIKSSKIISIEDPVEYRIEGVTQIQVHEELELTFDATLRRVFRQDPDIIMIGEIRDIETAELAIRAALTGHLVFATLHTNSAIEAVYRLQNMGIPGYMAAAVLRMVIAQRLVRKVCPQCQTSGCDNCSHTGYRGRTVIAEFLPVSPELSDMIARGVAIERLRWYSRENNCGSLLDDGEEKAAAGITTEKEIRRELGARQ